MALPELLHTDHQVLGEDYCPGYTDGFGHWNNGFPCPSLAADMPPVRCCGTATHKYCCSVATHTATMSEGGGARAGAWLP
ncbi:protein shisa-1-like, partial [Hyalella azteca]|uniref:Protein shisa-1-like n=1 Tax=Hyalella azteca TaxID=294128 RepID=A0A979FQS6_HYAAZ